MVKKILGAVIVLLAIGAAIPSTRARMTEAMSPVIDGMKGRIVPRRLDAMADQLDARLRQGQGLPQSWEGWLRRDYTGVPEDPWGNVYYLDTRRRNAYTVGSMGPDGEQGTDDDIIVRREMARR